MPQLRTDLTGNGAAVRTETQTMREMPIPGAEAGKIEVVPPETRYMTTQQLAPYVIGLLRGVYLGLFGAIGGLLTGLQMGSRDWDDLLWGMLIGFALGFLGRGAEAVVIDTPKATSTTEKV